MRLCRSEDRGRKKGVGEHSNEFGAELTSARTDLTLFVAMDLRACALDVADGTTSAIVMSCQPRFRSQKLVTTRPLSRPIRSEVSGFTQSHETCSWQWDAEFLASSMGPARRRPRWRISSFGMTHSIPSEGHRLL
jgi:hypothetical protein